MHSHCAFPFQKSDRVGNAVLRRDSQAQVDMIGHPMPLQQLDSFLLAQVPQDPTDACTQLAVQDLSPVLRDEHHMVLAVPPNMCQTLKVVHTLFLQPNRAFPEEERIAFNSTPDRLSLPGSHGHRPWVYLVLTI